MEVTKLGHPCSQLPPSLEQRELALHWFWPVWSGEKVEDSFFISWVIYFGFVWLFVISLVSCSVFFRYKPTMNERTSFT